MPMSSRWLRESRAIPVIAMFCWCAARADESVGGSLDLTSDYLVRGVSRSNQEPAVQADLHVITDRGFLAGLFASSAQLDSRDPHSAELSAFAGLTWPAGADWHMKIVGSYYGYLFGNTGAQYNYAELEIEALYSGWLNLDCIYSPDSPRYVDGRGLRGVAQTSAEAGVHTPWYHHLAASAAAGRSLLGGPGGGGYTYWSAGGTADLAPVSLSVTYVSTSAGAAGLFYGAAAHNQWLATLIWRF